jgi:hypothetical protein
MRKLAGLAALAALGTLAALGVQADVYKWVDEKGQTQYTETPPPAGAQKLNVPTGGPATAPAAAVAAPEKAAAPGSPEAKTKRCQFEKDQLRVLEGPVVTYKNDKGEVVPLEPAKKEAAKKQVQDNIKTYCS